MKKPISQELFEDLYLKLSTKIEETTETIFENVSIDNDLEKNYNRFMSSSYAKQFYLDESTYQKNLTIQAFIENEISSEMFTETYDHLVKRSDDSELSFSQQILLENTQEAFNVRYKGDSSHQTEIFEENVFGTAINSAIKGLGISAAGALGGLPLGIFAASAVLGFQLLFPSRYARNVDDALEKGLGFLGTSLLGTKSMLAMGNTSLTASNNNIINFDNIDANPEVKKLFNTLSRSSNKKAPIEGINSIVAGCLERNDPLNAAELNESQKGYFRGIYSPKHNTIFSVFVESLFKNSSESGDEGYNTLIKYRKCLSEKLVDMYKFLMIANISQSTEYKKIIRVMKQGFHNNPEQLLSFIHTDTESNQLNKENIIVLIKFRLFLDDMAKDLKKGTFDVDRESSIFLTQKLSLVDGEIEDYINKNKKRIETVHENRQDFDRKDFKFNKRPESEFKRKLMFGGK